MQVSRILWEFIGYDHDFASYYTFSLTVANDAENAQTDEQSLRKRSRPEVSIKSDTVRFDRHLW